MSGTPIFAVDLGATWLRSAVVLAGDIKTDTLQRSPTPSEPAECAEHLDAAWRSAGRPGRIAIAAAPELQPDSTVRRWPNRPEWLGQPLLSAEMKRLRPTLIDDATAASLSAAAKLCPGGRGTVVCLSVGTGIGGGAVVEGRPLLGRTGAAMDAGHIPVPAARGASCRCGRRGCLQAVASGRSLAMLEASAGRHSPAYRTGRRRAIRALAEAYAILHALFDADAYAVAGGLGLSGLQTDLNQTLAHRGRPINVVPHPDGSGAALVGAALAAGLTERATKNLLL
ncbi:ROK family protein [Mangrovicella endophytica]|uniref:ROK family protein n=1 Tax=Mangrovicella endophytica TaxID=2066697 RepID=UPI0012FFE4EC|nr:ROK family protein [Mangrovicella endophytica]